MLYPLILGKTVAGTVVAVGDRVGDFKVGDRVVSDTLVYKKQLAKYGAWQRYVVGNSEFTCNVRDSLAW
jgi:NADPH:quinone reductase-like Zn-dependent oxidoreductase